MSTTATENSTDSRSSSRSRTRNADRSEERAVIHFTGATEATENAVAELVRATVNAGVSLLPTVIVRPTVTVDAVFALAEQALTAVRRVAFEVASVVESGVDAAQAQAA